MNSNYVLLPYHNCALSPKPVGKSIDDYTVSLLRLVRFATSD